MTYFFKLDGLKEALAVSLAVCRRTSNKKQNEHGKTDESFLVPAALINSDLLH